MIDFDRVMVAGSPCTGEKGGAATGPSPVNRAKTGSKHHILTCGNGFPLAVALSGASVNNHLLLPTLLDRVRTMRGVRSDLATGSPT
ncbi:hypothetical protein [Nocardia tengchongensis]|uniref:hypothetical protein n=1 Tax=Nocardia tengchongensis TaxID=2055889 RepID=UPI003678C7E8